MKNRQLMMVLLTLAISLALLVVLWPAEIQPLAQAASVPQPEGKLGALFPDSVRRWETLILKYAAAWDYDPNFLAAVMTCESCGNPNARSHAGAMGLYQVMPFNFKAGENAYDPDINMMAAVRYLNKARAVVGQDYATLAAAYNGGIGAAQSGRLPLETQRFVRWVIGIWHEAERTPEEAPTFQEWLKAGGSRLCAAASR